MSISLSPELERQITERVESGEYDSVDEVVRYALELLSEEKQEYQAKLGTLRSAVDIGLGEIERGEAIPGPLAAQQVRAEFRRLTGRAP